MKRPITMAACLAIALTAYSRLSASGLFQSPVDYEISLAGNFGEPRPNHFHGGVDIKTGGVEGKHVYAIGDGYVSRVTVGLSGFGNAVYVTHPTGHTSIYCHLQRFSPRLTRLLRQWQTEHQCSYTTDMRLTPLDCPVSQGQLIAISGNTGHSTAPHLHLEIHDTRTWHMLDPLDFIGTFVNDTVPPQLHGIMACPIDGSVNGSTASQTVGTRPSLTAWGRVGFAAWADDYMQGSYNHYGIRETILMVDGEMRFHSNVDNIPVESNMLVNSWGDYRHYLRHHVWYMKAFAEPGNTLSILHTDERRGVITFDQEREYQLEFVLRDFKGNESHYPFTVVGRKPVAGSAATESSTAVPRSSALLFWNRTNSYSVPGMQLVVPYGQLATDLRLFPRIDRQPENLSDAFTFHDRSEQLLGYAELSIYPHRPVQDPGKLYIVCHHGTDRFMGGEVRDGWIVGKVRELGATYELAYDDEPPVAQLVGTGSELVLSLTDAGSGMADYKAFIDGAFVYFSPVAKSNRIRCRLREAGVTPTGGMHRLRLQATDNRNNSRTFEFAFNY